jgi:hypothetical protein
MAFDKNLFIKHTSELRDRGAQLPTYTIPDVYYDLNDLVFDGSYKKYKSVIDKHDLIAVFISGNTECKPLYDFFREHNLLMLASRQYYTLQKGDQRHQEYLYATLREGSPDTVIVPWFSGSIQIVHDDEIQRYTTFFFEQKDKSLAALFKLIFGGQ